MTSPLSLSSVPTALFVTCFVLDLFASCSFGNGGGVDAAQAQAPAERECWKHKEPPDRLAVARIDTRLLLLHPPWNLLRWRGRQWQTFQNVSRRQPIFEHATN
jgi:hypothetical protein